MTEATLAQAVSDFLRQASEIVSALGRTSGAGKAGAPATPSESGKPPTTGGASPLLDSLQRQADRVRDAAKWLLATLGAVAVILVAGLQFSAIGAVPGGWRTAAAVGGAAAAIVGVVVLIGIVLRVMLPSETTIEELAAPDAPKKLREYIQRNKSLLQGYDSINDLASDYQAALKATKVEMDAYQALLKQTGSEDDPDVKKAAAGARFVYSRQSYLDKRVGYVTKYLAVQQLQGNLGRGRRFFALLAAVAIGAGIGFYAWGTNAPKPTATAAAPPAQRGARSGFSFSLSEAGIITARVAVDDAKPGSPLIAWFASRQLPAGVFLPHARALVDESGHAALTMILAKTAGLQSIRIVQDWQRRGEDRRRRINMRIAIKHRNRCALGRSLCG